jgi:hypothetical protein
MSAATHAKPHDKATTSPRSSASPNRRTPHGQVVPAQWLVTYEDTGRQSRTRSANSRMEDFNLRGPGIGTAGRCCRSRPTHASRITRSSAADGRDLTETGKTLVGLVTLRCGESRRTIGSPGTSHHDAFSWARSLYRLQTCFKGFLPMGKTLKPIEYSAS